MEKRKRGRPRKHDALIVPFTVKLTRADRDLLSTISTTSGLGEMIIVRGAIKKELEELEKSFE